MSLIKCLRIAWWDNQVIGVVGRWAGVYKLKHPGVKTPVPALKGFSLF